MIILAYVTAFYYIHCKKLSILRLFATCQICLWHRIQWTFVLNVSAEMKELWLYQYWIIISAAFSCYFHKSILVKKRNVLNNIFVLVSKSTETFWITGVFYNKKIFLPFSSNLAKDIRTAFFDEFLLLD